MKPKIVCTLGTTTDHDDVLKNMIKYGMAYARMNTAYATIYEYKKRIDQLWKIEKIPIMMDIKGPQVRLESDKAYPIEKGDRIIVGFGNEPYHFNKDFYDDVDKGDIILFENGTIKTQVNKKKNQKLSLEVLVAGEGCIHKHMGVNVPGKYLNVERLSEKDIEVVDFSVRYGIQSIALSFVRDSKDILNLNKLIREKKREHNVDRNIGIVAKIEDKKGVENIRDIVFDARKKRIDLMVMVARGDLYVELDPAEMPYAQAQIIETCNRYDVPVITATGILESMQYSNKPTRAEVFDVYNAIADGSDYLMLSGETSNGKHPALVVKTLAGLVEGYKGPIRTDPPF